MQSYLFPVIRKGTPNPLNELVNTILPAARRSILSIDPDPPLQILKILTELGKPAVTKRILTSLDVSDSLNIVGQALFEPDVAANLTAENVKIKSLDRLTATLYIVDDNVMIVSGPSTSSGCYGLLLTPTDSQPVIEYWEDQYKKANQLTVTKVKGYWSKFTKEVRSGKIPDETMVSMINRRGAFIDVHVNVFKGCHRKVIHPMVDLKLESDAKSTITWNIIPRKHFQALHKKTNRIYAVKSRAYILDTPVGPFLLERDRARFEADFYSRVEDFHQAVGVYLDENYATMKQEASDNIRFTVSEMFEKLSRSKQILPVISETVFLEYADRIHSETFPSMHRLKTACSAWFVRFGLHPDSIEERLMNRLAQISYQAHLI